jgi:cob(I)alamin adenosyltransferase
MSIVTKRGDKGTTALIYGRRVPKDHPRVEAIGSVDELNAALGVARTLGLPARMRHNLLAIQKELIVLMGETGVAPADLPRYAKDGHSVVTPAMTAGLNTLIREIEAHRTESGGWAIPGRSPAGAALDLARTICRRAERRVCALKEAGGLKNPEIVVYLNRLGDLLWLLARQAEGRGKPA